MKKISISLLGLLFTPMVLAQDIPPRVDALRAGLYVAPGLSFIDVDDERGTDDGLGYGLALGYRGAFAAVELRAQAATLDAPGGAAAELQSVGVNMLMAPLVFVPWLRDVHFLLGYALNQRDNHPGFESDDQTYVLDTGLAYTPSFELFGFSTALRVEYIYRQDTQQPVFPESAPRKFVDRVLRLGLQIPLSKRPEPPQTPEKENVELTPVDSDRDGVPDDADRCPHTLPNAQVSADGCT